LIELFEQGDRRYLVARRNEPVPPPHAALTLRERQVIAYAAQGHSNKLIGYELGISASTVAAALANASKKLRVKSRLELIKVLTFGSRAKSSSAAPPRQSTQ
jgi:DNA-binding CsgD family transcriptional regulator